MLSITENVFLTLSLLIACFFILFSLIPMQRLFSLSKESGRNAAKYIIKQFPQYFDKTFAEPNVPVSFLLFIFIAFVLCQVVKSTVRLGQN